MRVMDEERYANDICLGEVSIPLKKIALFGEKREEPAELIVTEENNEKDLPVILVSTDKTSAELNTYTLFPMKEVSEPRKKQVFPKMTVI